MNSINKKFSIIVPSYGNHLLLYQWLESYKITKGKEDAEVIIIDDGSPENKELDIVYKYAEGLGHTVYRLPQNKGFTEAANYALRRSNGEIAVIQNTDVIFFDDDWLISGYKTLNKFKSITRPVIVGSKNLYLDKQIQHAGVCFRKDCRVEHIYQNRNADEYGVGDYLVPCVTGCGLMVEIKHLQNYGFFKDFAKYGWEDIDFCLAMRKLYKGKIILSSKYTFYHLGTMSYKNVFSADKDADYYQAQKYIRDTYSFMFNERDYLDYWFDK